MRVKPKILLLRIYFRICSVFNSVSRYYSVCATVSDPCVSPSVSPPVRFLPPSVSASVPSPRPSPSFTFLLISITVLVSLSVTSFMSTLVSASVCVWVSVSLSYSPHYPSPSSSPSASPSLLSIPESVFVPPSVPRALSTYLLLSLHLQKFRKTKKSVCT